MNKRLPFLSRTKLGESILDRPKESLVFKTKTDRKRPSLSQWRYLPTILEPKERKIFWIAVILLVFSSIMLIGRWYFRATDVLPKFGGSYTEALVGNPQYVNPILSDLSDVDSDLTKLLFSGLFRSTDNNELKTDLVTNYVVSEDQLTYTFFLRSDVKWHDGEDFTADDVIFTIQMIQDPLVQSPLASALKDVSIEKIDNSSFSLTLPEPFSPFLSSLTFGILPEHLWYNVPPQNVALTALNTQPIGTGPYKFDELTREQSGSITNFVLVRNDEYYGLKPYIDKLSFLFYPNISAAVEALKSKQVEGLGFFPAEQADEIQKKNGNVEFTSLRIPQYIAIFFNQKQSSKVLKNVEVRKALAYTVDRESIIDDVLYGQGEPIYSAILPGYVGYNPEVEKYAFSREDAMALLEEDGWKYPEAVENIDVSEENVGEKLFIPREKDGVKLEFTVATVDLPQYTETLALLQKNWQDIGVKVNVDVYSPEDIQNDVIKTRDYEALLFGEIIGTDPDPYPFWHSSQQEQPGLALSIFRDKDVDQLLEEARKTNNDEERRTKYLHFQNNIANDVQAIFLYNPHYSYAINKKIQGVNEEQYITKPADRFAGIANWYIKTDRRFKDNLASTVLEDGYVVDIPSFFTNSSAEEIFPEEDTLNTNEKIKKDETVVDETNQDTVNETINTSTNKEEAKKDTTNESSSDTDGGVEDVPASE